MSTKSDTHFNTYGGYPPADPLFVLFHSFLDYTRLLHTDCYGFDEMPSDELDDHMPYSFEVVETDLDYVMEFGVLCDTDTFTDPYCASNDISVRDMYDTSTNTHWNVKYQLGDFWSQNDKLQSMCADEVNTTWFFRYHGQEEDIEMMAGEAEAKSLVDVGALSQHRSGYFGWREYVFSSPAMMVMYVATAMIVVLCIIAKVVRRGKTKELEMLNKGSNSVYGTV